VDIPMRLFNEIYNIVDIFLYQLYNIYNMTGDVQRVGSRAQVYHGSARHTSGGLSRSDLKKNKQGKIVSKRRSTLAKRENRLSRAGYKAKKGEFKLFRKSRTSRKSSKSRKSSSRRGSKK